MASGARAAANPVTAAPRILSAALPTPTVTPYSGCMDWKGFEKAPFAARRDKLTAALGPRPALFFSGALRSRNYLGNTYPFRATSHFLYLFGWHAEDVFGLWDGETWRLFTHPGDAMSALWHGAMPSLDELSQRLGVAVSALDDLEHALDRLGPKTIATLPPPDAGSCRKVTARLGRPVTAGKFDEVDAPLVEAMVETRLIHDDLALTEMRQAAAATNAAHRVGMAASAPGRQEHDVRGIMEGEILRRGMACAYQPIVTVHGEVLHNNHYHHDLASGDMVLADVGAESRGLGLGRDPHLARHRNLLPQPKSDVRGCSGGSTGRH